MLTEQERALIKRWNDFAASPRSDIKAFRDSLDKICGELGITSNLPEIGGLYENVEMRPGLTADIAAPKGDGPHPVVVMLHGGGWAAGSLRTHRKLAMHFAANGYLTINVDYRLAPENPFPAGFDDCVFAAHWASENAHKWDGDPRRMALAGDSAGANLAAATMLAMSSDPNAPIFRAAVLIYGVFDFPSIIERAPSRAAVEGMAHAYLGSNYPAALKDPRVSPLRGIKAGALPPSFVICGTADALLPESRSIAAALQESGINCESREIDDMPHAFMMMDDLSGCREGHRMMFDFLRRRL